MVFGRDVTDERSISIAANLTINKLTRRMEFLLFCSFSLSMVGPLALRTDYIYVYKSIFEALLRFRKINGMPLCEENINVIKKIVRVYGSWSLIKYSTPKFINDFVGTS